jgi:nucleoside-diphosphate-sugar epimerase
MIFTAPMKYLFIGGTGNISAACVRRALAEGHQVYILNRSQRNAADYGVEGAEMLRGDFQNEAETAAALGSLRFDAVADFISFTPDDIARVERLFAGRCGQYVFVSSASAYQKPLSFPVITESTPLKNQFWEYSREKIACEEACNTAYRERDFPVTIVRPSLTYDTVWPVAIGGWDDFTLVDRIRKGGEMIVHGDGTSLWTVTHSEDFARGFNGLLGHPQALGHAFHITSDEALTWDQIYTEIAKAAGVEPKLVHIPTEFLASISDWERGNLYGDKSASAVFDNSKLKAFVPGFRAEIPFHHGIRRTLAWFEADPKRQVVQADTNRTMDGYLKAWRERH